MSSTYPQRGKSNEVAELPLACSSEAEAVKFLERKRWGDTPCCPRCGSGSVYQMKDRKTGERNKRFLWRCRDCTGKQTQFTVRTNSVFEESLLPLRLWCRAYWEAGSCKNGVSALELSRKLQVTHKTALFILNRLRHAMSPGPNDPKLSGMVECDEVYLGGRPRPPSGVAKWPVAGMVVNKEKTPIVAMIQRNGPIRAKVLSRVTTDTIRKVLTENVDTGSALITDGGGWYKRPGRPFACHWTCNHLQGEYVNPKYPWAHVNTAESLFARIRRAIDGTWIAVSVEHLPKYVNHCAFLMETSKMTDGQRVAELIRRSNNKRLKYRKPA
jgi:hypothetical protein